MKRIFSLAVLVALMAGCATVRQTASGPDVQIRPLPPQAVLVLVDGRGVRAEFAMTRAEAEVWRRAIVEDEEYGTVPIDPAVAVARVILRVLRDTATDK